MAAGKSLTVYPHQVYDACSYGASICPRTAVEVTITVSQPTTAGYVVVYATGAARPNRWLPRH